MYIRVECFLDLCEYEILFGLIGSRMFIPRECVLQLELYNFCKFAFRSYFSHFFLCIILFWEERDVKEKEKYIFTLNFNTGG